LAVTKLWHFAHPEIKNLVSFLNKKLNWLLHTTTMFNNGDYTVLLDAMLYICTTWV
jgi:hypothetical protein